MRTFDWLGCWNGGVVALTAMLTLVLVLINVGSALTTCSPEVIATQIAHDEKMSDKLKVRTCFCLAF